MNSVDCSPSALLQVAAAMSHIGACRTSAYALLTHSLETARLAEAIASAADLAPGESTRAYLAGLLHDVGKVAVPAEIIFKAEALDEDEKVWMRQHPVLGAGMLDADDLGDLRLAVLHHHERFDGCGYPSGLEGTRIPKLARIVAIADCYTAWIEDRPYRRGLTREDALARVLEGFESGHLDYALRDAFRVAIAAGGDGEALRSCRAFEHERRDRANFLARP